MTLYEILQVTEIASPEIIHAAYLALAKKYHPDVCKDNPEKAAEAMKNINAAYTILSDPNKRSQYDLYLRNQRRQQEEVTTKARPQYTRPETNPESPQHKNETTKREQPSHGNGKVHLLERLYVVSWIIIIGVIVAPIIIAAFSDISSNFANTYTPKTSETETTLQPSTEPQTGMIMSGYEPYNASQITVTASHTSSCFVKLKDQYQNDVISFYVRAGETATIDVPKETMQVYFASGDTWYGIKDLFGDDTYYSKDDTALDFENYSWEYTLYPVSDGNFTQTTIDAEEFN